MRKLLLFIFSTVFCYSSFAQQITATQSGDWSSSSTWGGGPLPAAGDTVIIPAGITVTLNVTNSQFNPKFGTCDTTSIPVTTVNGTLILSSQDYLYFNNAAQITINNGGTLTDNTAQNYSGGGGEIVLPPNSAITVQSGGQYTTDNSPTYFYNSVNGHKTVSQTNNSGPFSVTTQSASPYIILPVSLYNFQGNYQDSGDVLLKWNTASEINNSYFSLERSIDGNDFTEITRVPGAGTSSSPHAYQYVDNNIFKIGSDKLYYRLKQVDFDGNYSYSSIIMVTLKDMPTITKVWPNPGTGYFMMHLRSAPVNPYFIAVYNTSGKLILRKESSSSDYQINLSAEPKGIYILELQNERGEEQQTFKLMIQ